jgi:hypothetical protein
MYKQGTNSSVITVAKSTPHARDIAIGKNGPVAGVVVVISGIRPTKVVTEVRMMGRNRVTAAMHIALRASIPSRRWRFA